MKPLRGVVRVPGDKSISHRAALLAALARGRSTIRGFSPAGDCRATLSVLASLGARAGRAGDDLTVDGSEGLRAPAGPLDCRRSGTTMRLSAGLLAAAPFRSVLDGDEQLRRRPMERVAAPLREMGARITTAPGGTAPLVVEGAALRGARVELPVASAQLKSAVLLAGIQAGGRTTVVEPHPSRDHTERLLAWLGAPLVRDDERAVAVERWTPGPFEIDVPGDLSSAAPLLAAAALVPGSDVMIEAVGLNPTRTAFLDLLARMGATVETAVGAKEPEPVGSVRVRGGELRAVAVATHEVPALIDELPLVAVLAARADGTTEVRGAAELRVKESDRIAGVVGGLRALGVVVEELPDGFVVAGPQTIGGGAVDARGDHRLAMAFAVAGCVADGEVRVEGEALVADSFPGFHGVLERLR